MRSLRYMSLATRLGLLFAVLAVSVFGIAGYHLYHPLSHPVRVRDDAALVSTIDRLRNQLKEFDGIAAIRANPRPLLDIVAGQKGMFLTIGDSKGALLATSSKNYALLPGSPPFMTNDDLGAIAIRDLQESGGIRGQIISAWASLGDGAESRVLLLVSQEERQQMLDEIDAHRKDAPLELEEMVRAFNLMLDRLEDSFRRLTQFSSDIAHDLRTPISNLMVETQVTLAQRRSVREYEELLVSNVEEYERLTRMIENMLFLAHAENAQVVLHKETLSAEAELKRIVEYFEGMADEAGVSLDMDASGSLVADAILFRRAVSNLVVNAIRYTTLGEHISIRGYPRGDAEFVIEVSNPGVGIPPEHLPRIFDRFYRVDTSRVQSHASSGLGLAIVRSIAVLHGGGVQVESVPNGLTTFRLIFKW